MTPLLAVEGFFGNFWFLLALKLVVIASVVPVAALVAIYGELISAHMQSRIGPYFAGGRYGWAQPLADGLKFIQKEDLVPDDADAPVFRAAPYVVLAGTLAVFVIIPAGPSLLIRDLDLGLFYLLAVSSITTIGVLMAGWSSANKYSLIGGLRAAAQLIAYELPLVLAAVGVAIQAGTLSLNGIVAAQGHGGLYTIPGTEIGLPFVLTGQVVGFAIFVTASLAELTRTPFDMPIAESELVMGYLTEYSGFRFLFFFLAEFANMFTMSAIAATLFLGGYGFWGLPTDVPVLGLLIVLAKVFFLVFLMIWFRWTFPRLREDQLQGLAWKWLIPLSLVNIVVTGIFKVVI